MTAFALRFLVLSSSFWFLVLRAQQPYLQERPDFIKPCSLKDSENNACLSELIENMFQHWQNGVPGLRGVGALDPFRVGKLRIAQRVPPNLDVQVALRNLTTYGLSQAKILNSTSIFKSGHYATGFHVQLSKITLKCNYKLRGHVLVLNLNSAGVLNSEIDNLEFYLGMKMKPIQSQDLTFMNVTAIKTDVKRVDKVRINLTNLFGGNRELEDSANQLFNENWRVLYDVLRPVLTQTFDTVLLDRFSKIFQYVPAKYLYQGFD
ncbi:circadian clock-controlled protein daywake-like [Drosophila sulfurigaster albostrigata]|uniref:circadian clock-controlled protein daywake-like n=1 Tax=Drosophila sulfurigaster albostrigata TaxID=89887 RepID=UPI002D21977D|nr:circadian clock-controlled protein daywake-like [Drosophila sulfurigaster albostrigata]